MSLLFFVEQKKISRANIARACTIRSIMDRNIVKFEMNELLESFPPMDFAMAYGSVAFKQDQYDSSKSMLDLVFAVRDAETWHAANLVTFPHHYSSMMRRFGPKVISSIQQNYGAGLYYNTLVRRYGGYEWMARLFTQEIDVAERKCVAVWAVLFPFIAVASF